MANFQDLFSQHSDCYARARPSYPPELFSYLAGLVAERRLAWDVGTGNGQAAIDLAQHFDKVIATDGSPEQLARAIPHPKVEYRLALAEEASLESHSVDLVAIAQAIHWFRFDDFYANVRRVAKPGGIIAAWCYALCYVTPEIDALCMHLYKDITGPFWPADRKHIEDRYESIPFPFEEIRPTPQMWCREERTLDEYVAYLRSWSATRRYIKALGKDPIELIQDELSAAWGPENRRLVRWPIYMRIGRI